ncbi:GNAT family N-acetyltransferase [Streptomyces sp. NBC_00536]|uniref:GNAT family N-acetyltransferase n=1 Tax=Streptomyces sp. NBC_00536 TaxID=2975769 RepID=UPI002E80FAB7|nr:GNAT family N-acetyltransferase [Streptomyces sp. NBC_00536]WUC82775.1 GNAT family N-acetyltransferase [Streptomyces sp. NBC_00536]
MRTDVTLRPLDPDLLDALLRTAVADADPREVMPPVPGSTGWTAGAREAFLRFHRSRSLSAEPVEATFAVLVGPEVAGAARLCPAAAPAGPAAASGRTVEAGRTAEAGVWIGRGHRGAGVGGAVLRQLLDRARADGFEAVLISTRPDNTPVHRLITALGVALVHGPDAVTARVDLTPGRPA